MRYFLPFIFVSLSFILNAQVDKPQKFGVAINVNSVGKLASNGLGNIYIENDNDIVGGYRNNRSYSLGINAYYYIAGEFGVRLKVSTTQWNLWEYQDTLDRRPSSFGISVVNTTSFRSSDLLFAPGVFYRHKVKKIAFNGGFNLQYTRHFKSDQLSRSATTYTDISNNQTISTHTTVPAGQSYGIAGFAGFEFCPFNSVSFGLELSAAFLRTNIGGIVHQDNTVSDINGQVTNYASYPDHLKKSQFEQIKASFNISYWF